MSTPNDGMIDCRPSSNLPGPVWPLHVRILAVSCVLSYAVQWLAFLGLTGTAAVRYGMRRQLDGLTLGLGLGGVACFMLCGVYRRWFVQRGRRTYPYGKPE
jgi:hypothetical protein